MEYDTELKERLLAVLDTYGWEPEDLHVVVAAAYVGASLEREACARLAGYRASVAAASGKLDSVVNSLESLRDAIRNRGKQ